jgi:hypothetical protein
MFGAVCFCDLERAADSKYSSVLLNDGDLEHFWLRENASEVEGGKANLCAGGLESGEVSAKERSLANKVLQLNICDTGIVLLDVKEFERDKNDVFLEFSESENDLNKV